ncbi:unnamed protein product [Clonostachys rosea f. rosea IK726]|uniref:Uncharacterized protein n=2 Tax=Bionectria ochroleuca TaxID=29856 RepID=A0A0B7K7D4_BIOOC|nr:unnamed protein product [Clonostachys rosea f. rosea IK726]
MPRICAPVSKQLSRSVSSSVTAAARTAGHKNAGAVLMPKYAELLGKNEQSDSSRGITTTHRPTPQPSIANRNRPLMQTFSRSASASTSRPDGNLGTTILPSWDALYSRPSQADATPMVPIVPDNYGVVNVVVDAPVSAPEVTIVAVDPDRVSASSPFFEVTGLDGVDLKFAQQPEPTKDTQEDGPSQGMVTDIWKGMVDDILGRGQQKNLA